MVFFYEVNKYKILNDSNFERFYDFFKSLRYSDKHQFLEELRKVWVEKKEAESFFYFLLSKGYIIHLRWLNAIKEVNNNGSGFNVCYETLDDCEILPFRKHPNIYVLVNIDYKIKRVTLIVIEGYTVVFKDNNTSKEL